MSASRRSTRPLTLLLTAAATLAAGLVVSPAQAAVDAPGGLTPSGDTVEGAPVLTWDRVAGATSYDVEVATTSDFGSVKYRVTTTNRQATPNLELPTGEVWWRVQANSAAGDSDWSTAFYQRDRLAGPVLKGPEDGRLLDQPEEPALLSWDSVPGAVSYTIEIDDESEFITPTTYTTQTTSYVVPNPQIATTYYWRVRANLSQGVVSDYSDRRTYAIGGLEAPVLVSPADSAVTDVEDVVLHWQPVVGAATYELQISTDENFNTTDNPTTVVKGTRYSPAATLDNDQYFWRVRPVDTLGNKLAWSAVEVWAFRRHWPGQPRLEHPRPPVENQPTPIVGDPLFFQWTPVEKASHYMLELSESETFSTRYDSCTTVHTTYVPAAAGDCYPAAAGTYWWRVVAYDAHDRLTSESVRTDAIVSQVGKFSYLPAMVDLGTASPSDGATVGVPTLDWQPVEGAARYKVFVTAVDGGSNSVNGTTTAATTFTPRRQLTPGKVYRWWVQTVSGDGRLGPSLVPAAQSRFTVAPWSPSATSAPTLRSPDAGTQATRFPGLAWDPVAGASYYKVGIRPSDSIQAFTETEDQFFYPAGDLTVVKAVGKYDWTVTAYDAKGVEISASPAPGSVDVVTLPEVRQPQAAMTGTGTEQGNACTVVLPTRCEDLRQTPVLRWAPVDGAGGYELYLSKDDKMTNLVSGFPVFVDSSMWMSTKALIDSQAGDAFYWEVRPCVAEYECAPKRHAEWAFNKRSNPVELLSPAHNASVADDVTFTWRAFLATNSDPDQTALQRVDATGEPARIEAMRYRLEVSTERNFQRIIDTVDVDQTTYTAFNKTYPEGQLFWRVSAIDGSGNVLTSSRETPTEYRTFKKASPTPVMTAPVGGVTVGQAKSFEWKAMPFASSYDIEVYRHGDPQGQPGNLVFRGSSKQPEFTPTTPLPVSATPYVWRIRRLDADRYPGDWTDFASFRVGAGTPTPTTPGSGATLAGDSALFAWRKVAGAASYRFERRAVGSTSMAEVVNTPASAWAPIRTIGDGRWEWRVSTLDATTRVMASSEWQTFRVDGTSPTVTSRTPLTTAGRRANFVVQLSEPVKGVSPTTFRLFEKGVATPVPAVVTVDATGTKAVLDPNARLKLRKTYIAKVSAGITDLAGNALAPTTWKVVVR